MTDTFVVRAVVCFLGALAALVVVGGVLLTLDEKTIPDALIAIGSAAAGSLGTLLARTSSEPHPVEVVNRRSEPVPVDAGGPAVPNLEWENGDEA